jgi:tRNA dimethylallyltransferase
MIVVTGPTASGKTALGLSLARQLNGELVGADSVQVYRGMDIGSSKPAATELQGVAHHLIDVCEPDQPLDAMAFATLADTAIADMRRRGKLPIIVGGSGLWLRALLRGLVPLPAVDEALRARLLAEADEHGTPALHARLVSSDPLAAASIHPNDRVRVVRALEVFEQTGLPLGQLRKAHALGAPRYEALRVVLDPGSDALTPRIVARTRQMIEAGLAEETRALVARFGRDLRALSAVGYREMVAHVCDDVPIDQTESQIIRATRIYARRQRTWINGEPGERWHAEAAEVLSAAGLERIQTFLEQNRQTLPILDFGLGAH